MGMRSRARTMLKKTLKLIETGEKDAAKAEYTNTVSAYDKLANKNLVSKNKAARVASRLNAKLKAAFAG
jgi:small subunit ribosomal protein S20